ncbi:hypothetical protein [Alicyclobacillus sp. ALC3]|uniref:hypothetical protein n=1 Tax=Alicyclobacillus sp. ALC3 TaxID=2796143 RepID=UPI0023786E75|nr:hypothetical protein [Alicyclobacillus sp. ALC3]WDL98529.1 hypothetical protein JC200_07580 [Alicyclobacillus sp. ALC3]
MHEKLRIHHAVGSRVFFDSDREGVGFDVRQDGDTWQFTVQSPRTPACEQVLEFKDELNVFIFREENGQSAEKVWFYAGHGDVTYDDALQQLRIVTHGRITYNPADF